MKRLIFMTAAVGMMFTGCTNDVADLSLKNEQKVPISFAAPVMYGMTRAGNPVYGEMNPDGNTGYDKQEKFKVFAKKYSTSGMGTWNGWADTSSEDVFAGGVSGEEMKYVEAPANGWFPSSPYFFEPNYKYVFSAVSPSSLENVTNTATDDGTTDGIQIENFIPGELGQQIDVMYAPRIYDIDASTSKKQDTGKNDSGNTNDFYNGVNLKFKHALSSIHFKVCVDPEYVAIHDKAYGVAEEGAYKIKDGDFIIKSIKINSIVNKGTFNENLKAADDKLKQNTVNTAKWTLDNGTKKDYSFIVDPTTKGVNVPVPTNLDLSQNNIAKEAKDIITLFNGDGSSTAKGYYGLLIPQQTTGLQIEIQWKHNFRVKNLSSGKATVDKTEDITSTIQLDNYTGEWKIGERYYYTIAFRGNLIYFAPEVENWNNANMGVNDPSIIH